MSQFVDAVLDLALSIQQVPAPTFEETARARFVYDLFNREPGLELDMDTTGNVYARLPGSGDAAPLIVSAHLDTVFPQGTDLTATRTPEQLSAPGIGDNSLAVAALFGLLWDLRSRHISLPGDIWLVANTCEEGLGDLKGMTAVVNRFGATPRAYLILEGMALGHIYHRGLGVRRFLIEAQTAGGHSWTDYGRPSAIHELARVLTRLTELRLPVSPRTSLNVGRIEGGTSVNTVAAHASLELDLRSEGREALENLVADVERLVKAARKPGVEMTLTTIGNRPAGEIPADHPIVRLAQDCLHWQGLESLLTIGSTDANVPLGRGYPAVVMGITTGGGAHTMKEFVHTAPVSKGLDSLAMFVEKVF